MMDSSPLLSFVVALSLPAIMVSRLSASPAEHPNWLNQLIFQAVMDAGPSLYGIFPYAGLKFYVYEELKRRVPKKHEHSMTSNLACGSFAGLVGQTFTYPLDVVRRQMQVQTLSTNQNGASSLQLMEPKYKGTLDGLVTIVQRQGWKQLFAGLSINYVKVVPSVAIGFTTYDAMKSLLGVPSRERTHSGKSG